MSGTAYPPAHAAAPAHDRAFVVWLSLAQLITWGSVFYTFALLMEPLEGELGFSRAQTSAAFSMALLIEGLLAFLVGRWIDRGHERRVMTLGSLMIGLGLAAHAQVGSLTAFYAVWLWLGAGMAATLYAPAFAVLTRRFAGDFRRAIIVMTFLGGLASTVFIPLSSWLIAALGWREALWVLAALQFGVCAPLHFFWLRSAARATARRDHPAAGAQPRQPPAAPDASAGLARHLRSPPFLLIGVFVVGMAAVTAALPPHLINLLREAGLPPAWVIVMPASIGVLQVIGRLLLYFFEHHVSVHRANALIPCLIPIGLGLLLAGSGKAALGLLFVVFYGMGNGLITIVKGTAIAQYVDRTHVASLNGALGVPQALARAAAPLALGVLWTPEGGYGTGLATLMAVSALAVLSLWGAQRAARHRI